MTELARLLRTRLRAAADPARAPAMQSYMKSAMPFLGVSAGPLRQVCKTVFAGLAWSDGEAWRREVLAIWRGAEFREERYAALELTGVKAARGLQRIAALPIYEEMIVTGAWWDHVDPVATHRLWTVLENDRAAMKRTMLAWSRDADMWKRRSAILCQIRAKRETDLDLLYACIAPSIGSNEFFLRKAIGWALRQYAWTDPSEVQRYVAANEDRLSGLSRREALKNVEARA
jgi:3-methyladenine DNA glycosylase AlkD